MFFSLPKGSRKWYDPGFTEDRDIFSYIHSNIFNIFQNIFNILRKLSSELLLEYILPLSPEASFIWKKGAMKDKKILV